VVEPWGAHPSYAQGHYDRDNDFYVAWENISRDPATLASYLDKYVMDVEDRAAYMALQPELKRRLAARAMMCEPVNYGY
jgi:glutaconate CoA-transferase subunit A